MEERIKELEKQVERLTEIIANFGLSTLTEFKWVHGHLGRVRSSNVMSFKSLFEDLLDEK